MTPRLVWPVAAELGEGPVWFPREQALRFVDIKRGLLHRFVPETGARETLVVGGLPSFILPEIGGGLIVGSKDRLHRLESDQLGTVVAYIAIPSHNRTNDATVDGAGRIWFGTMDDDEQQQTGQLYCLDQSGLHAMGQDAVVTNGPAVAADGQWLYHVDSGRRQIWRLGLGEGPTIRSRELFLQLGEADGYPDGVVLDSEGCLWVALWDGWAVRRYAPDGKMLLHINMPVARATKIAFGGPDLRTAYVTTARTGLDSADLAEQPLAGALFAFDAGVAGVALPEAQFSVEKASE
jgi:xylono-1,5-lactonase